ncbi:MAG: hypothetical protein ACLGIA_09115, partial [Actinomycetes bacterium]
MAVEDDADRAGLYLDHEHPDESRARQAWLLEYAGRTHACGTDAQHSRGGRTHGEHAEHGEHGEAEDGEHAEHEHPDRERWEGEHAQHEHPDRERRDGEDCDGEHGEHVEHGEAGDDRDGRDAGPRRRRLLRSWVADLVGQRPGPELLDGLLALGGRADLSAR